MKKHSLVPLFSLLLAASASAQTLIAWNTLGSDNSYGPSGNWVASGNSFANAFTPTVSGEFDSLTAAIRIDESPQPVTHGCPVMSS